MANQPRAKHAFGQSSGVQAALEAGVIDARDILFLDEKTKPKMGWIDLDGNPVYLDTEQVVVIEDETLPETGEIGKVYIFGDEGYIWVGTEFKNLCKPTDVSEIEKELANKISEEELDKAVLDVVDIANAYTDTQIKEKIAEIDGAIEVVEF